jgi:hypothetical protein
VTGLLVNSFLQNFNRFKNIIARVNVVSGILLIIVGMLVMTNYLTVAGEKLMRLFGQ